MIDDINTKRTELANQMAAAGVAVLDFNGTAAALAAIPDTEPQQYVAAGTPENIAAILPATICPQRRMRHGERPSADDLEWGDAATSGDAPTDLSGAHHLAPDNIAAVIRDLRAIEDGTTEFPVEHRDWRTEAGVLARIMEHLVARIESAAAPERTGRELMDIWNAGAKEVDKTERLQKACDIMRQALCEISQPADEGRSHKADADDMRETAIDALSEAESVIDFGETVPERAASPATTSGDELTTTECSTCNGHGMIGGQLPAHAGGGYEAVGCDDCDGQGRIIVSRADLAAVSAATKPAALDMQKLRELVDAYRNSPLVFKTGERSHLDIAFDAIAAHLIPRPTDDHLWDETIRDRDTNQEWADKLADAIAKHFGADIGEHSNMNCPWAEALEVIDAATKPTADLSNLTRHGPDTTYGFMEQRDDGAYVLLADIQSLLATKPAGVPEGWKLVPVEPTPKMSAAGFCVSEAEHDPSGVYRAMLAAAPFAPTAAPADQVRNQALEDAAKTAEATRVATVQYGLSLFQDGDGTRRDIAEAIRALKSAATQTTEGAGQ